MLANRTRSHGSSLDMLFANMSEDVQTTSEFDTGHLDDLWTGGRSETRLDFQPAGTPPPLTSRESSLPLVPLMCLEDETDELAPSRPRARSRGTSIGCLLLRGAMDDSKESSSRDFLVSAVFSTQVPDLSLSLANQQQHPQQSGRTDHDTLGSQFSNQLSSRRGSFGSFDLCSNMAGNPSGTRASEPFDKRPFGHSFSGDGDFGLDGFGGLTPVQSRDSGGASWDTLDLGDNSHNNITAKREKIHIPQQRQSIKTEAMIQPAVMRATVTRPGRRRRIENYPVACVSAAAVTQGTGNVVLAKAVGSSRGSGAPPRLDSAATDGRSCHDDDSDTASSGQKRKMQIGAYTPAERKQKIARYLKKRHERVWKKKIEYGVRKDFANSRVRVGGRFVGKRDEVLLRDMMGNIE
jgi:hypothetical protein